MSKIGVDFDGVIANTTAYKKSFFDFIGYNFDYFDKTSIYNYLSNTNKSKKEIDNIYKLMCDAVFNDNVLFNTNKIDNADFALDYLSKNNDIYIITNRDAYDIKKIVTWLNLNGLEKYIKNIYSSSFTTKSQICIDNGITILIDDDLKHLSNCNIENIHFDIKNNNWLDILLSLNNNNNLITFFGPPASGKSTAIELCKNYDVIQTSMLLKKNTINTLGGNLISDDIVNKIIISELKNTKSKRIVLDGFPRTIKQLEELEKNDLELTKSIYLRLSKEELLKRASNRLTCSVCHESYTINNFKRPLIDGICDKCKGKLIRRTDDDFLLFEKRLEAYEKNTVPLISKMNNLFIVDQEESFENIKAKIKKIIL